MNFLFLLVCRVCKFFCTHLRGRVLHVAAPRGRKNQHFVEVLKNFANRIIIFLLIEQAGKFFLPPAHFFTHLE